MTKKILIILAILIIILIGLNIYSKQMPAKNTETETPIQNDTAVVYKNTEYGFNFSLPKDWKGYSIVKNTWTGSPLDNPSAQSGPKLLIRNPAWTVGAPYEDLPILVFTIDQWNGYVAEDFSVSAAPILASELGRNNKYVFALPPRWDFDYSTGYEQAQQIIASKPLKPFNL